MRNQKRPENKTLLKILSVFVAIAAWLIIFYTENPTLSVTIKDVRMQYDGEMQLFHAGYVLVEKEKIPEGVVVLRGSRSDLMNSMRGVEAHVNLSNVSGSGEYNLPVEYTLPTGTVHIQKKKISNVTVSVESVVEKEVPIWITQIGADKDPEHIVESVPLVDKIRIRGAASDVDQVAAAQVTVDVTALPETGEQKYSFVLVNNDWEQVDIINTMQLDEEVISVQNTVFLRKTVPVSVTFPSTTFEKYAVYIKSQSKKEVDIGVVDLETAPEKLELEYQGELDEKTQTYTAELTVPEGVYLPDKQLEIKLDIKKKTVKNIEIPITVTGTENVTYELSQATVKVDARGPEDRLNGDHVKAEIDISGLASGVHHVRVGLKSTNVDVDVLGEAYVTVTVHK